MVQRMRAEDGTLYRTVSLSHHLAVVGLAMTLIGGLAGVLWGQRNERDALAEVFRRHCAEQVAASERTTFERERLLAERIAVVRSVMENHLSRHERAGWP
jgi:hypothetical protein